MPIRLKVKYIKFKKIKPVVKLQQFIDTFKFTAVKSTESLQILLNKEEAHAKEHKLRRSKSVRITRSISS